MSNRTTTSNSLTTLDWLNTSKDLHLSTRDPLMAGRETREGDTHVFTERDFEHALRDVNLTIAPLQTA